jgi:uncharacterized protein (TIRG00374 family)
MDYAAFYSLAIAVTVLSVFFVAAAWRSLLNTLEIKTKLKSIFLYTWVGYFVDLVVPCQAICGEVARIYLVHKENRENYGAITASSITNRMITYVISSVGLFTGILLLLIRPNTVPIYVLNLLIVALIGTAIYLLALFYLAVEERAAAKLTSLLFMVAKVVKLGRFLSPDLQERTRESLSVLHQSFKTFRERPKNLVAPVVFQVFSLILNIFVYVSFLRAGHKESVHRLLHHRVLHRWDCADSSGCFFGGHARYCADKSIRYLRSTHWF